MQTTTRVQAEPYVDAETGAAYVALLVQRAIKVHVPEEQSGTVLIEELAAKYQTELKQRHVDFVTALINSRNTRRTYDFRVVSMPNLEFPRHGTLHVGLVCRIDNPEPGEAGAHGRELLNLAETWFPEYCFSIAAAGTTKNLLNPAGCAHVSSVVRRCGLMPLDSLKTGVIAQRRVGFQTGAEPEVIDVKLADSRVFHVFPFRPCACRRNEIFSLMLRNGASLALSIRLQPAALTPLEEEFLEGQIIKCERFEQFSLMPSPGDSIEKYPSLKRQAFAHHSMQTQSLYRLRDNAALMTIEAASPEPIPNSFMEMLGNYLTAPTGADANDPQESPKSFLSGGYEIVGRDGDADALRAFQTAQMRLTSPGGIPGEAVRLQHMFDSLEATAAFHLPAMLPAPPEGVLVQEHRTRAASVPFPEKGALLGVNCHGQGRQHFRMGDEDRKRHVYIIGQTGTGKTTLLQGMVLEDIRAGKGVCFIDPHGDAFQWVLARIPKERQDDVVVINPANLREPVGINLFECKNPEQRHFVAQEMVGIIKKLVIDENGPEGAAMMGPIFYQHVRMNSLLVMSDPEYPGTLLDFYNIFQTEDIWKKWLPLRVKDPMLEAWVRNDLKKTDYTRQSSEGTSMGSYISSKFHNFIFDPVLRSVFCQRRSTINFGKLVGEGRVVLVNLAKGLLSSENSKFLGLVILGKFMQAALERVHIPASQRTDFSLFVDEFQNTATDNFVSLLSEARKFGLNLVLANQFLSQLDNSKIMEAIYGNVGTHIAFRLGVSDAEHMARLFYPEFTQGDLVNLPNWSAYVSTLVNNQRIKPFSMETVLNGDSPDIPNVEETVRRSGQRYGTTKRKTEYEIASSNTRYPIDRLRRLRIPELGLNKDLENILTSCGFSTLLDLVITSREKVLAVIGDNDVAVASLNKFLKANYLSFGGVINDDSTGLDFSGEDDAMVTRNFGRL